MEKVDLQIISTLLSPTVRTAIEWTGTAWEEVSFNSVKNCWNHAKILPRAVTVTSGPSDAVIDELKALLVQLSDPSLDVESILNHATEQWTEAPESDDEEATAAYEAREESDVEEADDSKPVVPMTLREARGMGQELKFFVQENERMRPYLSAMESMVREMEAMTVSARTHQCDMHDYFLPVLAAADDSPAAGARVD